MLNLDTNLAARIKTAGGIILGYLFLLGMLGLDGFAAKIAFFCFLAVAALIVYELAKITSLSIVGTEVKSLYNDGYPFFAFIVCCLILFFLVSACCRNSFGYICVDSNLLWILSG